MSQREWFLAWAPERLASASTCARQKDMRSSRSKTKPLLTLGSEVWNEVKEHYLNPDVAWLVHKLVRFMSENQACVPRPKMRPLNKKVTSSSASSVSEASRASEVLKASAHDKVTSKSCRASSVSAVSRVSEVLKASKDDSDYSTSGESSSVSESLSVERKLIAERKQREAERKQPDAGKQQAKKQPVAGKRQTKKQPDAGKKLKKKIVSKQPVAGKQEPKVVLKQPVAGKQQTKVVLKPRQQPTLTGASKASEASDEPDKKGKSDPDKGPEKEEDMSWEELPRRRANQDELEELPPWRRLPMESEEFGESHVWPPPLKWRRGDPERWGPGDWECSRCRNHNFKFRGFCHNRGCGTPRDHHFDVARGDWYCKCGNFNFSKHNECNGKA